jgi:hypothetical protein
MHDPPDGNLTITEIESVVSLCCKGLETADHLTRQSLSHLVGHLLAATQLKRFTPDPESSQKGKQDLRGDEESLPSQTASEPRTMLTPEDMFVQLSAQFNKPSTSRRVRVGIFDFYAALLNKLGSSFVESNYPLIVAHFMTEIVFNTRSTNTLYEKLLVRNLVEIILRDLIGVRMLSEQGQIAAIQELSRSFLKRWPAMMPGHIAPSPSVLVIILRETAGLLRQLGNAPPPVQVCLIYHEFCSLISLFPSLGRSCRASADPSYSSKSFNPRKCFTGIAILLLFDTLAVAKNDISNHGPVTT